jgi:selenide,water dikinase
MKNLEQYTSRMIYPDNTMRNWQSYEARVEGIGAESLLTLCDPQTNGGLLVCVDAHDLRTFEKVMHQHGYSAQAFGKLTRSTPARITLLP